MTDMALRTSASTASECVTRLPQGVIPPLVTPFTPDLSLDLPSLRRLCEFLITAGVDGLYPCGTTGEFILLTAEERRYVAGTVLSSVSGRIPVVVHVGSTTTSESIALGRHAIQAGADGVGVIAPYFYEYDDEALRAHFLAVAEAVTPVPVYLYNLPSHARNAISPQLAARLFAEAPNIAGIKDSAGDVQQLAALRTISNKLVLSGADGLNLAALQLGCDGMISGNANAVPEPFVSLVQSWRRGELGACENAQVQIDAVRSLLATRSALGNFKQILVARGVLRSAAVRAPQPSGTSGDTLLRQLGAAHISLTSQ